MLGELTLDELLPRLRRIYFVWVAVAPLLIVLGHWLSGNGHRWARRTALLVPPALLVLGLVFYFPFTNDDTFIFLRYADNLINGRGPVYNAGERCEGFTSPLWLALLAIAQWLGADPLRFAKFLGALLALATVALMYRLGRMAGGGTRTALLGAMIMGVSQNFASWAVSGMDLALFLSWEMALLFSALRAGRPDGLVTAITAVGFFIRPEAYLVSAVVWVWLLGFAPHPGRRSATIACLAVVVAVALVPVVGRVLCYGDVLPNTYYAKSDRTLRSGLGYLVNMVDYWGVMVVGLAALGLWMKRRVLGLPGALAAALIVYLVIIGGDVMDLRLALLLFPLLLIGFSASVDLLLARAVFPIGVLSLGIALLFAAQSCFQMYDVTRNRCSGRGHLYVPNNAVHTIEADKAAGLFLAANARPTDLVATDNIGAVGYYSGLAVLDTYGLTNRAMARLIRANNYHAMDSLLAARSPEWILCFPGEAGGREHWNTGRIGQLGGWVYQRYQVVKYFTSCTGYRRILLRRTDRIPGQNG